MSDSMTQFHEYCYLKIIQECFNALDESNLDDAMPLDHTSIDYLAKTNEDENITFNYNTEGMLHSTYISGQDGEQGSYQPAIILNKTTPLQFMFEELRSQGYIKMYYLVNGKIIDSTHPYCIVITQFGDDISVNLYYYSTERMNKKLPLNTEILINELFPISDIYLVFNAYIKRNYKIIPIDDDHQPFTVGTIKKNNLNELDYSTYYSSEEKTQFEQESYSIATCKKYKCDDGCLSVYDPTKQFFTFSD